MIRIEVVIYTASDSCGETTVPIELKLSSFGDRIALPADYNPPITALL
jgi:hypothetical protein